MSECHHDPCFFDNAGFLKKFNLYAGASVFARRLSELIEGSPEYTQARNESLLHAAGMSMRSAHIRQIVDAEQLAYQGTSEPPVCDVPLTAEDEARLSWCQREKDRLEDRLGCLTTTVEEDVSDLTAKKQRRDLLRSLLDCEDEELVTDILAGATPDSDATLVASGDSSASDDDARIRSVSSRLDEKVNEMRKRLADSERETRRLDRELEQVNRDVANRKSSLERMREENARVRAETAELRRQRKFLERMKGESTDDSDEEEGAVYTSGAPSVLPDGRPTLPDDSCRYKEGSSSASSGWKPSSKKGKKRRKGPKW